MATAKGPLYFRAGHGRLVWRVDTFYTEEPETVRWLETLGPNDVFWDIGANVGMYSIYAAHVAGCRVMAFEPEAQNFALLMENIALNRLGERITPTNLAVTNQPGLGRLVVHAITKGGAYNQFVTDRVPAAAITQLTMGMTIDEMVEKFGCPIPTYIKIDVDGNEPEIVAGASRTLANPRCRSVLIEIRIDLPEHITIERQLHALGFQVSSRRSNWESRENRDRRAENDTENVIFTKK